MTVPRRFVVAQFILFAVFAAAWLILPRSESMQSPGIAPVVLLAPVIIFLWALASFQRQSRAMPNVTPTPNQQTGLVQSGIYKWIRHPIYTAVITGALGASLLNGHPVVYVLVVVFAIFFTFKSSYEETLLSSVFPEYASYRTRTGLFLPFL